MLKTNSRFQTQLPIFADVALVCLAMVPALALHKLLDHWIPGVFAGKFDFFWDQAWLFVLIVLAWAFVFDFSGGGKYLTSNYIRFRTWAAAVLWCGWRRRGC